MYIKQFLNLHGILESGGYAATEFSTGSHSTNKLLVYLEHEPLHNSTPLGGLYTVQYVSDAFVFSVPFSLHNY